jgi:flagellar assembly protein FliH
VEAQAKNLYKNTKNFTRSYLPSEEKETSSASSGDETSAFELHELIPKNDKTQRDFIYDSKEATNFDAHNINRAKEGVIEIVRDALNKAKSQAVEIRETTEKEAREKGHAEGFQKGELDAKEEFKPVLETTEHIIQELSAFRKKMYPKVEREMIEMVISLVKKVIHFELSTKEDSVQEMIRLAVQAVLDKETMTIKINPADKEHAENFRPELQHLFGEIKNISFEPNTGIERGGCIIETNFGTVDARMDKLGEQIDKILHLAPPPAAEINAEVKTENKPEDELENNTDSNSEDNSKDAPS